MQPQFDSQLEQQHAAALEAAGFIRCDTFGSTVITFKDKKGNSFTARPDFYNPKLDLFIDLKNHALNTKTSIDSCATRLQGQLCWHLGYSKQEASLITHNEASGLLYRAGKRKDVLSGAWSHALLKHVIVQTVLTPERYIVVFESAPNAADAKRYKNKGLTWRTLSELLENTKKHCS